MPHTTIRPKGQITIPTDVRERLRLETGDLVIVEVVEDAILIRPQKLVDATQTWFWADAWQVGEREASAERRAARGTRFKSGDQLIEALKKRRKKRADV